MLSPVTPMLHVTAEQSLASDLAVLTAARDLTAPTATVTVVVRNRKHEYRKRRSLLPQFPSRFLRNTGNESVAFNASPLSMVETV